MSVSKKQLRQAAVLHAMDTVIRFMNDEGGIDLWLMNGVADGDGYEEILDYNLTDAEFDDMCDTFYRIIKIFGKSGWYIPSY